MTKHDDPASARPVMGRIAEDDQDLKDCTVDGLRAFAERVRKASDELAGTRPGAVAALLDRAMCSLQNLSARTTPEAATNDLARLMRQNPAAVLAATILTSFALGEEPEALSPANEQAARNGVAGAPVRTAQTGAGGLGYLEEPEKSE